MPNYNSNLVDRFLARNTLRTANYRGSPIVSTMVKGGDWSNVAGNNLYLCVVPYTATILKLEIGAQTTPTSGVFNLAISGINSDLSFTEIKGDLITGLSINTTVSDKYPVGLWGRTIYQQLCTGDPLVPIDAFKKYKDDAKGVLSLKVTTQATASPANTYIRITWVEGSPSEMPLTKIMFEKE